MSRLSPDAQLALLMLEELAIRGGRARLKYVKTYRQISFWLGPSKARYIVETLARGSYLALEGDRVVLLRHVAPKHTLTEIQKMLRRLIAEQLQEGPR